MYPLKKIGSLIIISAIMILSANGQTVISGSPNVFSNSQATATISLGSTYSTPSRSLSINHGGLLATTNFSAYYQIAIVDAITGVTNYINVGQVWQAQNTNSTTETVILTNFSYTVQTRLVLTTTNAMNIPTSAGAATYVTNTIIFN